MKEIRQRYWCKVVSTIIILAFLYSSTIWAMGCPNTQNTDHSCLAPATNLPLVTNEFRALCLGESVFNGLEELNINGLGDLLDVKTRRLEGRVFGEYDGRTFEYVDLIRNGEVYCLMLPDQQDKGRKRAVYVFDKLSGYFSRITTEPKVNDLLYEILDLEKIKPVSTKKIKSKKIKRKNAGYQNLYYLEKEDAPLVISFLEQFYGEEISLNSYPIERKYRVKSSVPSAGIETMRIEERCVECSVIVDGKRQIEKVLFRYSTILEEAIKIAKDKYGVELGLIGGWVRQGYHGRAKGSRISSDVDFVILNEDGIGKGTIDDLRQDLETIFGRIGLDVKFPIVDFSEKFIGLSRVIFHLYEQDGGNLCGELITYSSDAWVEFKNNILSFEYKDAVGIESSAIKGLPLDIDEINRSSSILVRIIQMLLESQLRRVDRKTLKMLRKETYLPDEIVDVLERHPDNNILLSELVSKAYLCLEGRYKSETKKLLAMLLVDLGYSFGKDVFNRQQFYDVLLEEFEDYDIFLSIVRKTFEAQRNINNKNREMFRKLLGVFLARVIRSNSGFFNADSIIEDVDDLVRLGNLTRLKREIDIIIKRRIEGKKREAIRRLIKLVPEISQKLTGNSNGPKLENNGEQGAGMIPAVKYLFEKQRWNLKYQALAEQVLFWAVNLGLNAVIPGLYGFIATAGLWILFFISHFIPGKNMPQAPPWYRILIVASVNILSFGIFQCLNILFVLPVLLLVVSFVLTFLLPTAVHYQLNLKYLGQDIDEVDELSKETPSDASDSRVTSLYYLSMLAILITAFFILVLAGLLWFTIFLAGIAVFSVILSFLNYKDNIKTARGLLKILQDKNGDIKIEKFKLKATKKKSKFDVYLNKEKIGSFEINFNKKGMPVNAKLQFGKGKKKKTYFLSEEDIWDSDEYKFFLARRKAILVIGVVIGMAAVLSMPAGEFIAYRLIKPRFLEPKEPVSGTKRKAIEELKRLALEIEDPELRNYAVNFVNCFIQNGRILISDIDIIGEQMQNTWFAHYPDNDEIVINYREYQTSKVNTEIIKAIMVHEGKHITDKKEGDRFYGKVPDIQNAWMYFKSKTGRGPSLLRTDDLVDSDGNWKKFPNGEFYTYQLLLLYMYQMVSVEAAAHIAEYSYLRNKFGDIRGFVKGFKMNYDIEKITEYFERAGFDSINEENFEIAKQNSGVNKNIGFEDYKKYYLSKHLAYSLNTIFKDAIGEDGSIDEDIVKRNYILEIIPRIGDVLQRRLLGLLLFIEVKRGTIDYGPGYKEPVIKDKGKYLDWIKTGIFIDEKGKKTDLMELKLDLHGPTIEKQGRLDLKNLPPESLPAFVIGMAGLTGQGRDEIANKKILEEISELVNGERKDPDARVRKNRRIEELIHKRHQLVNENDLGELKEQLQDIKKGKIDAQKLFENLVPVSIFEILDGKPIKIWHGTLGEHLRDTVDNYNKLLGDEFSSRIDREDLEELKNTFREISESPDELVVLILASILHDYGLILDEKGINTHAITGERLLVSLLEKLIEYNIVDKDRATMIRALVAGHVFIPRLLQGFETPETLYQFLREYKLEDKLDSFLKMLRLFYFADFMATKELVEKEGLGISQTKTALYFSDVQNLRKLDRALGENPALRFMILNANIFSYSMSNNMDGFYKESVFNEHSSIRTYEDEIPSEDKEGFSGFLRKFRLDFFSYTIKLLFAQLSGSNLVRFIYLSYLIYNRFGIEFNKADLFIRTQNVSCAELLNKCMEEINLNEIRGEINEMKLMKGKMFSIANIKFEMDENNRLNVYADSLISDDLKFVGLEIDRDGNIVKIEGLGEEEKGGAKEDLLHEVLDALREEYGNALFVNSKDKTIRLNSAVFENKVLLTMAVEEILLRNLASVLEHKKDGLVELVVLYRVIKSFLKNPSEEQEEALNIMKKYRKVFGYTDEYLGMLKRLMDLQSERKLSGGEIILRTLQAFPIDEYPDLNRIKIRGKKDIVTAITELKRCIKDLDERMGKALFLYNHLIEVVKKYEEKHFYNRPELKAGLEKEYKEFMDKLKTGVKEDEDVKFIKAMGLLIVVSTDAVPFLQKSADKFLVIIDEVKRIGNENEFAWQLSSADFLGYSLKNRLTVEVVDKRIFVDKEIKDRRIRSVKDYLFSYGLKAIEEAINNAKDSILKDAKQKDITYGCKIDIDSLILDEIEEIKKLQDEKNVFGEDLIRFHFYSTSKQDVGQFVNKYGLKHIEEFSPKDVITVFDPINIKHIRDTKELQSEYYLPIPSYIRGTTIMALAIISAEANRKALERYGIWGIMLSLYSEFGLTDKEIEGIFSDPFKNLLPRIEGVLEDLKVMRRLRRMVEMSA